MLIDHDREGSPVRRYLDEDDGTETGFNLLIQVMRVCAERDKVNAALLEVLKSQAHITPEETNLGSANMPRKKQSEPTCCLECGNWPEDLEKAIDKRYDPPMVKCGAGFVIYASGNGNACARSIPKNGLSKQEEQEESEPTREEANTPAPAAACGQQMPTPEETEEEYEEEEDIDWHEEEEPDETWIDSQ